MNSGLYARAGASATATAAAWLNRFDAPITKVSKMYFSFSRDCDRGPATSPPDCEVGAGEVYDAQSGPAPRASSAVAGAPDPGCSAAGGPGSAGASAAANIPPSAGKPPAGVAGRAVPLVVPLPRAPGGSGTSVPPSAASTSTTTARFTVNPRCRPRASLIGRRRIRSIASFANSLGAASRAVPSMRPRGRVRRRNARCWADRAETPEPGDVPDRYAITRFHT